MSIAALLAGLFSGIIASMGMGGGAVLLIYLHIFLKAEPTLAQGINLLFFIPIGAFSLCIYFKQKQIDLKTVWPLALLGLLGALLGLYLTTVFDAATLSKIFGLFLLAAGLKEIFAKDKNNS